jgi:P27 family predicted phage terminase small subunit
VTRGRKPKPREVKIASGNPGRRKLPEPVLVGERVAGDAPLAPAGLDEWAAVVWGELAQLLTEGGVLTRGDLVALEGLAVMVGRARQARAALVGEPLVVRGSQSWMIPNPLLRIERDAWAAAQRVAVEFGMTPSARARLGLTMVQGRSLGLDLARRLDEATAGVPTTVKVKPNAPAPRRRRAARGGGRSS